MRIEPNLHILISMDVYYLLFLVTNKISGNNILLPVIDIADCIVMISKGSRYNHAVCLLCWQEYLSCCCVDLVLGGAIHIKLIIISPFSWQSSTGEGPPTSPSHVTAGGALLERASRLYFIHGCEICYKLSKITLLLSHSSPSPPSTLLRRSCPTEKIQ